MEAKKPFGGVVVGTTQYWSPEQATFNNLDVDTRSDIYALGVALYELLELHSFPRLSTTPLSALRVCLGDSHRPNCGREAFLTCLGS
jgi:serine/threonine protein kinase